MIEIERLYRDLPTSYRDRWDLERFRVLASAPVIDFGAPAVETEEAFRQERVQLPELQRREVGGLACRYGVKVEATWIPSILERGCFADAKTDGVKVLYQHSAPIGVPTYLKDLPVGLAVVGRVSETSLGNDVMVLAKDKVLDMFSVGFNPTEYYFKEDKDTKDIYRHIQKGELYEFSVVARGACPGSDITDVKMSAGLTDPRIDRVLEILEEARKPGNQLLSFESRTKLTSFSELEKLLETFELDDAGIDRLVAKLTARRKETLSFNPSIFDELERLVGAEG